MGELLLRAVTASWQAAVMVVLIVIVTALAGNCLAARWRCALWMLVFARLLMPALPPSPWSVFNLSAPAIATPPITGETVTYGVFATEPVPSSPVVTPPASIDWLNVAALAWIAIAAALIARHGVAMVLLARRLRRLPRLADPRMSASIEAVETDLVATPAIVGLWRPLLLLPRGLLDALTPVELRFVIRHESAHAKRRDTLVGLATTLITCVHWFNPLIWLAAARFRAERELACDEMVLAESADAERRDYGNTILSLLGRLPSRRSPVGAVGVVGSRRAIRRRIAAIASGSPARSTILGPLLFIVMGCATLTGRKPASSPPPSIDADPVVEESQDPRDTLTRVYDVRDLIVEAPDFAYAPADSTSRPATQPLRTREEIVRDLMTTITSTVDPLSWRDNTGVSGSIRELNGQLIVTQTPRNHERVQALLQKQRRARGVQVTVEARFLNSPAALRFLERGGKRWAGSSQELWSRFLDEKEVDRLLRETQGDRQSTIITAPRLTLFNGQRAYVLVNRQSAYVADLKPKPGEKDDVEAVIKTADSGVVLDCQARVGEDQKFITLSLRPKLTALLGFRPEPWPHAPAGKSHWIQVPLLKTHALDATITMPDRMTAVYRISPRYEATSRPSGEESMLLLVKPTTIMQAETEPKQFPLLSTRAALTAQPAP